MTESRVARLARPVAFGAIFLIGAAASAQTPAPQPTPLQPVGRSLDLGRDERLALQALETAARLPDRAAQDAALAAARSAVRSNDGRYALGHYQLEIARLRQDIAMASQAVDAMVSSGMATSDELASLLINQAGRAYQEGEYVRAERLLSRAAEAQPNNHSILADTAQVKSQIASAYARDPRRQAEAQAAYGESVTMLRRAIELQRTSGQPAPESWYLRALSMSFDRNLAPQGIGVARDLVTLFPSSRNWRDALLAYKQLTPPDPALDLDIRRLMRAAQALAGERDYLDYVEALRPAPAGAGLAGERKAVLEEGISRGMLDANEPRVRQQTTEINRQATAERGALGRRRTEALAAATGAPARAVADAYFGSGQYAEAAELYQAALQKGGEDANLVNTRLGAALALAGRRAEAEAAFRAVTGPRADLAGFWLAWLMRRPG
jgi:tetratricopeptide (TPR) repeat protein